MLIRKLPDFIINQIAAGEVVERPASIVKELLENSIDANATEIEIHILGSGKSYISVYDNGDGIPKNDIPRVIELHTTSKLPDDDLINIAHLGFRGEALASISSVAKLSISSKFHESPSGWSTSFDHGIMTNLIPSNIQKGTLIEVKDLFFSIPGRLNFLRSDSTELQHIINTCKQTTIPHKQLAISLYSEERKILNLKSGPTLFSRVLDIVGHEFQNDIIEIKHQQGGVNLYGFISKPTVNFSSTDRQFCYINGRFIRDKVLASIIRNSFSDLIPRDRYPICFLLLDIPYTDVDVNVHPRKLEVRFKNPKLISNCISTAISDVLKKTSNLPANFTTQKFVNNLTHKNFDYIKHSAIQDALGISNIYYSDRNNMIENSIPSFCSNAVLDDSIDFIPSFITTTNSNTIHLGTAITQFCNKYILSKTNENIFFIDQHAVCERVNYDKLQKDFFSEMIAIQKLLIPFELKVTQNEIALIMAHEEFLASHGLIIKPQQSNTEEFLLIVDSVPAILSNSNLTKLINDITAQIFSDNTPLVIRKQILHVLSTHACHNSIRAGQELSIHEMNQILRFIETYLNTAQCNHGRPSYVQLSPNDLDKIFNR